MINVKLFGGPDDGAVASFDVAPTSGLVTTYHVVSPNGGVYRVAICQGWPSRGMYLGPACRLHELPSLGAPGDPEPGSRNSTPGAPSDDEAAG